MDDQLKNLRPDFSDLEERANAPRNVQRKMDTSQAIIMAAIIIISGYWGGNMAYAFYQEQRAISYLKQMNQSIIESRKKDAIRNREMLRRSEIAIEKQQQEKKAAQQQWEQKRQAEQTNAALAKKRSSNDCRFWWDQYESNSTEINKANKTYFCGE